MKRSDYIAPENWYGSFYELAIEYVPQGDDERLRKAIAALWDMPSLVGPWRERQQFGQSPSRTDGLEFDESSRLYGVLELSNHQSLGCLSVTVREDSGPDCSDWLDFCIPTGMLELVFHVSYPLHSEENPWMQRIDTFLLSLAERVYQASPFELANIGEEVSGRPRRCELTESLLSLGGILLPLEFAKQFEANTTAVALPSGLRWFP